MTERQYAWTWVLIVAIASALILWADQARSETVLASVDDGRPTHFDGGNFHGRISTGERFSGHALAVAHRTLPLHSCIEISYRGRAQTAIVNDRGPCLTAWCQHHAPSRIKRRELDMTPALARILRFPGLGTVSFHPTPCNESHNGETKL